MEKTKKFSFKYYKFFGFLSKVAAKALFPLKVVGDRKIDKPALILTNHVSFFDFMFVAAAFYPQPFNIVVAEKMANSKKNAFYINKMGCITRAQFTSDAVSIMRMKRDMQSGASIMICPEGRITASGVTGYIPPSTAKLVKWLKCDVIFLKISGAFAANPSWDVNRRERLPITVDVSKRLTAEQVAKMDNSAVMEAISASLFNNDFDYLEKIGYDKKRKNGAVGLERLLYRCPVCGKEFETVTEGNEIACNYCKKSFRLTPQGKLIGAGEEFDRVDKWFETQRAAVRKEISETDFSLTEKARFFTLKENGYGYEAAGEGAISFNAEGTRVCGTLNGKALDEFMPAESLPVVSYGPGRFLDFYIQKPVRLVPENVGACTKLGLIVEELHKSKTKL